MEVAQRRAMGHNVQRAADDPVRRTTGGPLPRLLAAANRTCRSLALVLLPAVAWAQDEEPSYPLDIELLRPGLSPWGTFSIDAPQAGRRGLWSAGALLQYERAPLRLFDGSELMGHLVANRAVLQAHVGVSASKRTSFSLMVPVGVHFGADADVERARNGAGLGDIGVTVRYHGGTWGSFSLGGLGTLMLPTGNPNQYMGERLPRARLGLLGHTEVGRLSLLTNLLVLVRGRVETDYDLTAGPELQAEVGANLHLLPDELDIVGELIGRVGLARGDDMGRFASELVAGVRYHAPGGLKVDLAVGRGLTGGYGTSQVRAMVGLTYVRPMKPEPEPPPPPLLAEIPDEEPLYDVEEPPPPPPPPPAELKGEEIIFRDPIEFEQGTTVLRPESGAVLDAVAGVILAHPEVGHVVIEGHASAEGEYAYNYELSGQRAQAIYEALLVRGVYPKRMSYRGAGEVEPVVGGEDEAALARNRRVVFRVVRQYAPNEARPADPSEVLRPWSGEVQKVGRPPDVGPIEPPPPAPAAPTPIEGDDE